MSNTTTSVCLRVTRIDLLHAHGSPTSYLYKHHGCRCAVCVAAERQRMRRYYEAHRDTTKARTTEYRKAHPAAQKVYQRTYRDANREKVAEGRRRYREEHSEQLSEAHRRYRKANREKRAEYGRRYFQANPDVFTAQRSVRRARVLNAPGNYRSDDVRAQYKRQHGRCFWCKTKVGTKYHIDHVLPLARGGGNGPENIVISCSSCNHAKGANHPMDWAGVLC